MTNSLPESPNDPATLDSAVARTEKFAALLAPEIAKVRQHLHRYPELSGSEFATSAYLAAELAKADIPHRPGPGGVGVLVESANGAPSFIALRADIDALPIAEENAVPYRSEVPGVMHACGHDAHAAMVLGAMRVLHQAGIPDSAWRGVFQSSEETGQGALDMVKAGALANVAAILALHVDPNLPASKVVVAAGPQTSCCQDFRIEVQGRGGHAARPHLTIDPIEISAQLIRDIYEAVPRQLDPHRPAVVSITQISGGHCSNVIPDTTQLGGTIRTLDRGVSKEIRARVENLCAAIGERFGAEIRPSFDRLLLGVVNDPKITELCAEAAREVAGPENTITENTPSLGAEDFADYLTVVPGCMMRVGVRRPGKKITPLHTPTFDIDETALLLGVRLLVRAALKLGASLTSC